MTNASALSEKKPPLAQKPRLSSQVISSTWKMRRLVFVVAFIIQETKQRHTILENEPNLPDPSWPKFSTLRANPTQLDPSFDPECPTWPVNWINLRFIKKKFGLYNSNIYDLEGQNEMILLLILWIGNKI